MVFYSFVSSAEWEHDVTNVARSKAGSSGLVFVFHQQKVSFHYDCGTILDSPWIFREFEIWHLKVGRCCVKEGSQICQAAFVVIFWPLESLTVELRLQFSRFFWLFYNFSNNCLFFSSSDRVVSSSQSHENVKNCVDFAALFYTIGVNGNGPNRTIVRLSCSSFA